MADDDPFDLRADIDDFEAKLLAKVRADEAKKSAARAPRRTTSRPSLKHLSDRKVREDIARLIQVKLVEFTYDATTTNSTIALMCHCGRTSTRLIADETVAAMSTADEVNAIFEELDTRLRSVCNCKKPRPAISMR